MSPTDLAGRRFGRLTVIKRIGTASNGAKLWLCRCDCGAETRVRTDSLVANRTKSCGCLARDYHDARKRDYVGQTFGRLTVISQNDGRPRKATCRCTCGNLHTVEISNLLNGNVRSCGCLAHERKTEKLTVNQTTERMEHIVRNPRSDNKTGRTGVRFRPERGTWVAAITYRGKRIHLGNFKTFDEAVIARENAEVALFGRVLAK